MNQQVIEIRWHGRGGQGVKTAATMFAEMAVTEGKYSQGFPEYGPERMGAPVAGYTRISSKPIRLHCTIEAPGTVVVLDETLLDTGNMIEGIRNGGAVIVNTARSPEEIRAKLGPGDYKAYVVDATKISIEEIGRPIPNTPMVGALIKVTGAIDLKTVEHAIEHKFGRKLGEKGVKGNIRAIERAHQEVRGG